MVKSLNMETTCKEKPENSNPGGHRMIDGTTELEEIYKTEENKTLVKNFVEEILVSGKMENSAHT
jgi:hypothetical protein